MSPTGKPGLLSVTGSVLLLVLLMSGQGSATVSSSPISVEISGTFRLGSVSFDTCSQLAWGYSCPVDMTLTSRYRQSQTVQLQGNGNGPFQKGDSIPLNLTLASWSQPDMFLDLNFTNQQGSIVRSYHLSGIQTPGKQSVSVRIDDLRSVLSQLPGLANIGLIGSPSTMNVTLSLATRLEAVVVGDGVDLSDGGHGAWKDQTTLNLGLTGNINGSRTDSSVSVTAMSATALIGGSVVIETASWWGFTRVNTLRLRQASVTLGTSQNGFELARLHWYQVDLRSPYSTVTGSGWYTPGTTATVAIQEKAVNVGGVNYDLVGWSGLGLAKAIDNGASYTFTVNAPVRQTATWTSRSSGSTGPNDQTPSPRGGGGQQNSGSGDIHLAEFVGPVVLVSIAGAGIVAGYSVISILLKKRRIPTY